MHSLACRGQAGSTVGDNCHPDSTVGDNCRPDSTAGDNCRLDSTVGDNKGPIWPPSCRRDVSLARGLSPGRQFGAQAVAGGAVWPGAAELGNGISFAGMWAWAGWAGWERYLACWDGIRSRGCRLGTVFGSLGWARRRRHPSERNTVPTLPWRRPRPRVPGCGGLTPYGAHWILRLRSLRSLRSG